MMNKEMRVTGLLLSILVAFSACDAWEQDLGQQLLPPGDQVFLFHDTLYGFQARVVSGEPVETSDRTFSSSTLYLLGSISDTITGTSRASVFTHFNPTSSYIPATNTEIDSVVLELYIEDFISGDPETPFTIRVHESTRRIHMDSVYFSDFEAEGNFRPAPLGEATIRNDGPDTVSILLDDASFVQRFLDVQDDTVLFRSDSLFKDYFKGLYLAGSSAAPQGAMARIGLSNLASRLAVHYANDSTEVDTTAGKDFRWAYFTINEFTSQKVNVFEHDYGSTYLSGIIDKDSIDFPYCYVQGMQGVNTLIALEGLEEWIDSEPRAISSATLVFDVVPEEISGIGTGALPERLIVFNRRDDGGLENLHDYYAVAQADDRLFGGVLDSESRGMFFDTTYTYRFNVGLHFQAMVDGRESGLDFLLKLYDSSKNPKYSKLWSNLPVNPRRIRLEVVYVKL